MSRLALALWLCLGMAYWLFLGARLMHDIVDGESTLNFPDSRPSVRS